MILLPSLSFQYRMSLGNKTNKLDNFILSNYYVFFSSFKDVMLNSIISQSDESWYTFSYLGNVNTLQSLLWNEKRVNHRQHIFISFDPMRQVKWCGLHVPPFWPLDTATLSICVYILTPGFPPLGTVLYLHENL